MTHKSRVTELRQLFRKQRLSGLIIPRQDEFQGEYVAAYAERLRWLTGFAGSWGMAILTLNKGAIFVDGRYTIQVRQQVDTKLFTPHHLVDEPPANWITENLKKGDVLGYDPWLLTADQAERFAAACAKAGAKLQPLASNPIDAIWKDQPKRPTAPLSVQPLQFAGQSVADKLAMISKLLAKAGANATVLTQPDSVAWVFNIRGHDVPYTPVVLAYAILRKKGKAELFIDRAKLPEDVQAHLRKSVTIKKPAEFEASLKTLGKSAVQIDGNWAPAKIKLALAKAKIINATDLCVLPKARKNKTEQEGARAAHRRDGVAMSRFLCWLEAAAPQGGLTEWSVAEKLEQFRRDTGMLLELSFDSIAGAGPNAAIPHYHVNPDDCLPLNIDEIFLIDSGGQYQDGTTDITRTVIVGEPTQEMRDRFTRVLKGMIDVSRIRFPKGTCGSQIDVLARQSLWAAGLDYDHGTGHGVGSYLSVHEGPARINKSDRIPLEPGMILSNEPGFYKQNEFGIRIENLLLIHEAKAIEGGERPMLGFETLTLCPIERRLIDTKLLTRDELHWLDTYHARVLKEVGDHLSGDELTWLRKACAPFN
ncbi:MAG: aminopeptidase P family protein [Aestuariivirga sp.]|nr:aminopeptidase P family protein [Aestuariivirga sp.]